MADQQNLEELIPRIRRAIEEPDAPAPLTDQQVLEATADAIADIMLFAGELFDHQLVVLDRDDVYNAPIEWAVEPPLTTAEEALIVAQAAITAFGVSIRNVKTSETIRNEGQEWSYSVSASAMTDQLKALLSARDRALDALAASHPIPTSFVSWLEVRDAHTAALIEPWTFR